MNRSLATLLVLSGLLSGCASTKDMMHNLSDRLTDIAGSISLSGGSSSDVQTGVGIQVGSSGSSAMASTAAESHQRLYTMDRPTTFKGAVRAARALDWTLESARREDPYIVALPKATVFRAREAVYINVLPGNQGTRVELHSESGQPRNDFVEFFAELDRQLTY